MHLRVNYGILDCAKFVLLCVCREQRYFSRSSSSSIGLEMIETANVPVLGDQSLKSVSKLKKKGKSILYLINKCIHKDKSIINKNKFF